MIDQNGESRDGINLEQTGRRRVHKQSSKIRQRIDWHGNKLSEYFVRGMYVYRRLAGYEHPHTKLCEDRYFIVHVQAR